MCRKVAHKASATAGTVASALGDTSVRVADGIVSRMGNSNYGRSVLRLSCCLAAITSDTLNLSLFADRIDSINFIISLQPCLLLLSAHPLLYLLDTVQHFAHTLTNESSNLSPHNEHIVSCCHALCLTAIIQCDSNALTAACSSAHLAVCPVALGHCCYCVMSAVG